MPHFVHSWPAKAHQVPGPPQSSMPSSSTSSFHLHDVDGRGTSTATPEPFAHRGLETHTPGAPWPLPVWRGHAPSQAVGFPYNLTSPVLTPQPLPTQAFGTNSRPPGYRGTYMTSGLSAFHTQNPHPHHPNVPWNGGYPTLTTPLDHNLEASAGAMILRKDLAHVPCKFVERGKICQYGNRCPYSHDTNHARRLPCKYNRKGKCRFKNNCANSHEIPWDVPAGKRNIRPPPGLWDKVENNIRKSTGPVHWVRPDATASSNSTPFVFRPQDKAPPGLGSSDQLDPQSTSGTRLTEDTVINCMVNLSNRAEVQENHSEVQDTVLRMLDKRVQSLEHMAQGRLV